jgi:dihydrodipicolinate synthase/N-acetylneuraminate lyase
MKLFKGVFPAVVTPFTEGGTAIHIEGFRRIVDHLLEQGVHGLFVGGTTGEGPSLTVDERELLTKIAVEKARNHDAVVIIHCSCNNPALAIQSARNAD